MTTFLQIDSAQTSDIRPTPTDSKSGDEAVCSPSSVRCRSATLATFALTEFFFRRKGKEVPCCGISRPKYRIVIDAAFSFCLYFLLHPMHLMEIRITFVPVNLPSLVSTWQALDVQSRPAQNSLFLISENKVFSS